MGYVLDKPKRLSRKQVAKLRKQLDRSGQADIRKGTCRFVAKGGVEICRDKRGSYTMVQMRDGSSRALRREALKRGVRYV